MGIYSQVYIGPYIEYRVKLVEVFRDPCNKTDCPKSVDPFCSQCGISQEYQKQIITQTEDPKIRLHEDPFNERLHDVHFTPPPVSVNGYRTYQAVPNIDWGSFVARINPKRDDHTVIDMMHLNNISDEISLFERYFSEDIKNLKEMCGAENVKVKFGAILWFS